MRILLTFSKEVVMDPIPFLRGELAGILKRVTRVEASKWAALAELGLRDGKGGGRS